METALRKLDVETWGERLRRARERSGLTLRQAEQRVGAIFPTSWSSLARLEKYDTVPTGRRSQLAYVAVVAYGYDPDDFGFADLPAGRIMDRERILNLLAEVPVPESAAGLLTWRFWQLPGLTCAFRRAELSGYVAVA